MNNVNKWIPAVDPAVISYQVGVNPDDELEKDQAAALAAASGDYLGGGSDDETGMSAYEAGLTGHGQYLR